MYLLPSDFDVAVFADRQITDISVTANTAVFAFGSDLYVTVWGAVEVARAGGAPARLDVPFASEEVDALRGARVRSAGVHDRATVALELERQDVLRFLDDGDAYESYEIGYRRRTIIV